MKKFLITIALSFLVFSGMAQCPPNGHILINTQQQLDQFIIDYPNCTVLESIMVISGSTITNLLPLRNLTAIGVFVGQTGELRIWDCPNLTSLDGLENIEYAVNISLSNLNITSLAGLESLTSASNLSFNNIGITNFAGLENLETVSHSFRVTNNENLLNFVGLNSITELGSFSVLFNNNLVDFDGLQNATSMFGGGQNSISFNPNLISLNGLDNIESSATLNITDNALLQDLDEFANITFLHGLQLINNPNIVSITGLTNVDPQTVTFNLSIKQNASLSNCDAAFICEILSNPNVTYSIWNNAPGCDSPQEVAEACGVVLSINELDILQNEIKTFPNPVTNTLSLLPSGNIQLQSVQVISTLGEQLLESKATDLDFSNFSNGIYFLKVDTDKGSITKKIVKQ